MIEQAVSLLGAAMILLAYAGQQLNKFRPDGLPYILLNLIGSLILAVIAIRVRQMGLTVLEGAWAIITTISLVKHFKVART